MIIKMTSTVTEIPAEFAPGNRRYLALCLEGRKPGAAKLPLGGPERSPFL